MPFPLEYQSGDMTVSVGALRLSVDSKIEVNELVEIPLKGIVNPVSSTMPNRSLYDEPEVDFNYPRPEVFSSKIKLRLMIICCLTGSNSR